MKSCEQDISVGNYFSKDLEPIGIFKCDFQHYCHQNNIFNVKYSEISRVRKRQGNVREI